MTSFELKLKTLTTQRPPPRYMPRAPAALGTVPTSPDLVRAVPTGPDSRYRSRPRVLPPQLPRLVPTPRLAVATATRLLSPTMLDFRTQP
jgi:hypothetical protein